MTHTLITLAQAGPGGGAGGGFMSIVPMVAIFAIFYFLVLRPQSRKAKEHNKMLSELKKGEDVVTTGGVIGRITGITDGELVIQVQEGVRLRVLRSAVTGRYTAPDRSAKTEKAESKAS